MKILVTGATGFLGSNLIKALLKNGHEVCILKRSFSDAWRINEVLSQISTYDIDLCELEKPFKEQGKIDVVIHTATCYGRKGENIKKIIETNILFPLMLLEIASSYGTDVFINVDTFFNINNGLYKYLNEYVLSKKHFLEWAKQFANTGKICLVNTRLEHIYGPHDDETKFTNYVIKSCLRNVSELQLTEGEQKRDFIYIDDVVDAYMLLIKQEGNQVKQFQEYEIGSGQSISIRTFVELVHTIAKSNTRLNFGALPYRENEIMISCANTGKLSGLGWRANVSLKAGISAIINEEFL
ncbi:Nucleoside-diphosphate-sugar epimerase [Pelosinus fermentans]|uniref:NAD-dependent epimerase/dehydratase family protein n=1 Tax=Pelosinus fermentans TaxID=365349 RepID=UPI0002685EB0|nr:NAD(P)-dependent oxidoreductase [Pelosinus fermentans]OAM92859.1 NAD-dependent epimerase/dehydratase [Pelosinus fermentans DSM 17108]SDQ59138.1 Nucleoside-diphosphate-sugar epimerase [Pelosinus fermentans]